MIIKEVVSVRRDAIDVFDDNGYNNFYYNKNGMCTIKCILKSKSKSRDKGNL